MSGSDASISDASLQHAENTGHRHMPHVRLQTQYDMDNACRPLLQAIRTDAKTTFKSDLKRACYKRFLVLLERRFKNSPIQHRTIGGAIFSQQELSFQDFQIITAAICNDLSRPGEEKFNLAELAESLVSQGLVLTDNDRFENVQQLVFSTLGWVSMLFVPSLTHVDGKIAIDEADDGSSTSTRHDTWVSSEQELDGITGSLRDVLLDFSNDVRGPLACIGNTPEIPLINTLSASNLNFYVLTKLGGLQIRWTDSICMHLELNRRAKTVTLFWHPSICVLMCQEGDGGNYLDSLFRYYFGPGGLPPSLEASPAGMFYKEVLLTYRLLFGQHKRSWKLGRETVKVLTHGARSWKTLWFRRRQTTRPDEAADTVDSLLGRLCGLDCSKEQLYDAIGAPDVRSVYSAQQDFPFFGDRLIALQEYVRLLEPADFRALFYDRRDLTKFFSFLTAMIFGVTTFLLSIMAVALAAGQIAISFRTGN